MTRSVEDALYEAGQPVTFEEVCALLPKRSTAGVSRGLAAAEKMGRVRRDGPLYEYIKREER